MKNIEANFTTMYFIMQYFILLKRISSSPIFF